MRVDSDFAGASRRWSRRAGSTWPRSRSRRFLLDHPAVEQAYVIGLPDSRKEEILAAVIVLKEGHHAEVRRAARLLPAGPGRLQGSPGVPPDAAGRASGHRHREGPEVPAGRNARAAARRRSGEPLPDKTMTVARRRRRVAELTCSSVLCGTVAAGPSRAGASEEG
jgi:hypothetical protein